MDDAPLPLILMGPMVRRAETESVCIQFASSSKIDCRIVFNEHATYCEYECVRLGKQLFHYFVTVFPQSDLFSHGNLLSYRLYNGDCEVDLSDFCYVEQALPQFSIPFSLTNILHGSCRNPHHPAKDSLVAASDFLQQKRTHNEIGADILLLSGDQIYADDVAGAMLIAIQRLINVLGIYKEQPLALNLPDDMNQQLYQRHHYLPKVPWQTLNKIGVSYWFKKDAPHFSSLKAANHLTAFEEYVALYLLSFSVNCWQLVDFDTISYKTKTKKTQFIFDREKATLADFISGLKSTQILFANISSLTMFDDHDVTDDWNLTPQWEQVIYSHPVSRRIVNNGLISYWLFQGIGNDAGVNSASLLTPFKQSLNRDQVWQFNAFDKVLLNFNHWHYELNTVPKIVVLDTRTHRWRNEQNGNEPSGLLDWQRLTELEESLITHKQVIIVSPAPVFGVKSIEAIQALFNICGQPLLVDVENWMAHEGSAKKLLDIFRRKDTPKETLILSGDVHYSFCFSVQKRFAEQPNRIWQLTASGIKNEFPRKLINVLDKLDSILYGPKSPLNFFTKRWHMEVDKHQTTGKGQKYLVSDSAISLITLEQGDLARYRLIHGDGRQTEFDLDEQ